MSNAASRREYQRATLDEPALDLDPFRLFAAWIDDLRASGTTREPDAAVLATAGPGGIPTARVVLVREAGPSGFVFYTDYRSRKAEALAQNPEACLLYAWLALERQVRVQGRVERLERDRAEAYFAQRPRGSQLGAWASTQSAVLSGGRPELERRLLEVSARFADGQVPLPPHWGGYCLRPEELEFWQGRENRLHDRIRYRRDSSGIWTRERLSP